MKWSVYGREGPCRGLDGKYVIHPLHGINIGKEDLIDVWQHLVKIFDFDFDFDFDFFLARLSLAPKEIECSKLKME